MLGNAGGVRSSRDEQWRKLFARGPCASHVSKHRTPHIIQQPATQAKPFLMAPILSSKKNCAAGTDARENMHPVASAGKHISSAKRRNRKRVQGYNWFYSVLFLIG